MASIYYGTCPTEASVAVKDVEITSMSNDNGINNFDEGDILVILFHHTNTIDHPSIRISNTDSNEEISISNDVGVPIKVRASEVSLSEAWVDGETKIFVFTRGQNDVYYFELIGSIKGDANTIGNVKIMDWSTNIDADDDAAHSIALSPYGAQVMLDQTEGLVLNWNTGFAEGGNNELLGELSILKNDRTIAQAIPIYYPTVVIPEINYTNQLWNNGPKKDETLNNTIGAGNPFLTRYIPGNISFYSTGEHLGLQVVERNGNTISNPYLIFEVTDANGNTNIFSKGNITFSAAPKTGDTDHFIIMGGTTEGGRVGNTVINGTLKVNGEANFPVGIKAKATSTMTTLHVSDSLKINNRDVLIGRYHIAYFNGNETAYTIYDEDIAKLKLNRVICTMQDGAVGVDRVSVDSTNSCFTVHFTRPIPANLPHYPHGISFNYICFRPQ